jgi:hypothetical protein
MWRFCIDRHAGKTEGVFIDGSTRKIGLKGLWRLRWHREWPDWMANMSE